MAAGPGAWDRLLIAGMLMPRCIALAMVEAEKAATQRWMETSIAVADDELAALARTWPKPPVEVWPSTIERMARPLTLAGAR